MKKLLALLLAVSVILGCMPVFAAQPTVDAINFFANGQQVTEVIPGTAVEAIVLFTDVAQATAVIASYDLSGRLLNMKAITEENSMLCTPTILTDYETKTIKVFAFENTNSIKPLCAPAEINILNSADKITVNTADIADVTDETVYITFEYWANETDRKPTAVTVNSDAPAYKNGVAVEDDAFTMLNCEFYGTVTLQKLNGGANYDAVFVDEFSPFVVAGNDADTRILTSMNNADEIAYRTYDYAALFDRSGNKINWRDLVRYDSLSVRTVYNNGETTVIAKKLNEKITGEIEAVDSFGTKEVKYHIGDSTYGAYWADTDNLNILNLSHGDFYLDELGNIGYFKQKYKTDFAYIVNTGINNSAITPATIFKAYTSGGEFTTLTSASKVKVDGIAGINSNNLLKDYVVASFTDSDYESLVRQQGTTGFTYNADTDELTVKKINIGDVIAYTTNEEGKVISIDRPTDRADFSADNLSGRFTYVSNTSNNYTFDAILNTLNSSGETYYVTDSTKIMSAALEGVTNITTLTADDFFMADTSKLNNGDILKDAYIYSKNDGMEADFVFVTKESGLEPIVSGQQPEVPVEAESGYGYVTRIAASGIDSYGVQLYTSNGELKGLNVASPVMLNGEVCKDLSVLVEGTALNTRDVISYETNEDGELTAIDTLEGVNNEPTFLEYISGTVEVGGVSYNVTADTIIMIAEMVDDKFATADDFGILNNQLLVDEQYFENATVYAANGNNAALIVVEAPFEMIQNVFSSMAVITDVGMDSNDDGDDILNIKVFQDGLIKDGVTNPFLTTVDDTLALEKFSTILPKVNYDGDVEAVTTLVTLDVDKVAWGEIPADKLTGATNKYYYGDVTAIDRKNVTIANGRGLEFSLTNYTNLYIYDDSLSSKNRVFIDSLDYVDYDDSDGNFYIGKYKCKNLQILAREYDGIVTEAVLYIFR